MDLTEADIEAFRKAWKAGFDEDISVERARAEALILVELFTALAKPLPRERGEGTDAHET